MPAGLPHAHRRAQFASVTVVSGVGNGPAAMTASMTLSNPTPERKICSWASSPTRRETRSLDRTVAKSVCIEILAQRIPTEYQGSPRGSLMAGGDTPALPGASALILWARGDSRRADKKKRGIDRKPRMVRAPCQGTDSRGAVSLGS